MIARAFNGRTGARHGPIMRLALGSIGSASLASLNASISRTKHPYRMKPGRPSVGSAVHQARGKRKNMTETHNPPARFDYSKWRHGGWYVHNVRYPSGAIGCVSRNYEDGKWRIACDPRPFEEQPTFRN